MDSSTSYMVQWRTVLNMVMNFRVPWKARNLLNGWATTVPSRRTLLHGDSMAEYQIL